MKNVQISSLIALVLMVMVGCRDFDEIGVNANRPASVPPSLVLRGVLNDITEEPWSLDHRRNQFWSCNYGYYGNNEYWTNANFNYLTLKNVMKMEEEAAKSGSTATPYHALGKYFRAHFFVRMTQRVGDVPMDEALKGLDVVTPLFNTQKQVYIQVLTWLDEANDDLQALIAVNDLSLQGDIYYQGDLRKWQRAINSFKIRVLISLSKKENDADLNVKARFAAMLANPSEFPLMASNADNMHYVYNGTTELYPTNPGNRGFDKGRYNMTATYVKSLTDLSDPRVFVVANPAKKKITDGLLPTNFAAYVGAPAGESLDDMTVKAGNGEYSFANQKRYYSTFAGFEPGVQLAYWEQCFNIAEGINRGWATGNAQTYYNNGITASMAFYGITEGADIAIYEPDNDTQIGTAVDVSVAAYLAQPAVAYLGNTANGLNQILLQKYLAFFQNSGQEAFFNFRRTGVPTFHTGPGTGNSGVIPKRWLYPTSENLYNNTNLMSALQNQFGSQVDDVDNELWINQ
jgi:hypothetical protein